MTNHKTITVKYCTKTVFDKYTDKKTDGVFFQVKMVTNLPRGSKSGKLGPQKKNGMVWNKVRKALRASRQTSLGHFFTILIRKKDPPGLSRCPMLCSILVPPLLSNNRPFWLICMAKTCIFSLFWPLLWLEYQG